MNRRFLDHLQCMTELQASERPNLTLCCDPLHSLHKLYVQHYAYHLRFHLGHPAVNMCYTTIYYVLQEDNTTTCFDKYLVIFSPLNLFLYGYIEIFFILYFLSFPSSLRFTLDRLLDFRRVSLVLGLPT